MTEANHIRENVHLTISPFPHIFGNYANALSRFLNGFNPLKDRKERNEKDELKFFMEQFFDFLVTNEEKLKIRSKLNQGGINTLESLVAQRKADGIRLQGRHSREILTSEGLTEWVTANYKSDSGIEIDADWTSRHKALAVYVTDESYSDKPGLDFLFMPGRIDSIDRFMESENAQLFFDLINDRIHMTPYGQIIFIPQGDIRNYSVFNPVMDFPYRQLNNRKRTQFIYISDHSGDLIQTNLLPYI